MKRSSAVLASLSFLLLLSACEEPVEPTSPDVSPATQQASEVSGKIVLLDPALAPGGHADNRAAAASVAREYGVSPDHSYGAAVYGFAGIVPEGRLAALQQDDRVVLVEDVEAWELAQQAVPTGMDRIELDRNPEVTTDGSGVTVAYDLAIIDTGISDHEDLTIGRRVSFAGGDGTDGNGHGTHVAGTAAAVDNGVGVVGAAPGATVHAVKVCKNGGICLTGDIVAGIDWVTARKADANTGGGDPIDFAAANMSIGTSDEGFTCEDGDPGAVHQAICGAVNEGVVFGLAGGNDDREKVAYPEAFAVSAIADFDGKAGAAAAPTCRSDEDDTRANFSNWGASMDVAAPGVCIRSTWNDGGYNTISGTSMAAPHATGAVALYLHANGLSPATNASGVQTIEDDIRSAALPQGTANHECSYDNDSSDQSSEGFLFVNATAFGGDDSCEVAEDGGGGDETGDNPPAIDSFDVSTRVTGPWNRVDVAWAVSDQDGDLAAVTSELLDADGNLLDDEQSAVSGSDASGEHGLRTRTGGTLTVRLTVTDGNGNATSQDTTVNF